MIYPNFLLSLSADHVAAFTVFPRGPHHTTIVCDFLFHPDEIRKATFDPSDAVEFWDQINCEDWGISELSQLGIASRAYTPGPYSAREELLVAFDRIVTQD